MSSVRVPLLEFSFASATPRLAFTKKISDKPLLVTTETAQNIFTNCRGAQCGSLYYCKDDLNSIRYLYYLPRLNNTSKNLWKRL